MRLAGALLVVIILAGCLGGAAPSDQLSSASMMNASAPGAKAGLALANASFDAPTWSKGDAWLVENKQGSNATNAVLVVTSADSNGYTIATTDPVIAQYDAMFDVSYVGHIRGNDLAGAQGATTIKFFEFPLKDGKSWTTKWDGGQVNLTAKFQPSIPTPLGPQPGFMISGEMKGKDYVNYDFVPALRWWSHLDFNGYGMRVTGVQPNWTGQIAQSKAKTLLTLGAAAPVASTPAGSFTVDASQTWVILMVMGGGAPYAGALLVVDPAGTTYPKSGPDYGASPAGGVGLQEQFPAAAGDWHVIAPAVNDPSGGFVVLVMQVQNVMKSWPG